MKKALIVGLNEYPRCSLNWCDNDAVAIKDLIESNGDGFIILRPFLFLL